MSPTAEKGNYGATWTWSDCPAAGQCRVLTATVGRRYRDYKDVDITGTTSPSFTPTTASGWLKAVASNISLCTAANTATATCRPVPTGTV
jgi:hypothetical protein